MSIVIGRGGGGAGLPGVPSSPVSGTGTSHNNVIGNPGIGWLTSNGNTILTTTNPHGIPSTLRTYRIAWQDFEPTEGSYQYDYIDAALDATAAAGQQIVFRFIAGEPAYGCPAWVKNIAGYTAQCDDNLRATTDNYPDWTNATVKTKYTNTITALANRYKNHPAVAYLQVGSIGLYAEWHWNATYIQTKVGGAPGSLGAAIPMPGTSDIQAHIDTFMAAWAFPASRCMCGMDSSAGFTYGTGTKLTGWFQDGFGYRPSVASPGYHMGTEYPTMLGSPTTNNNLWQQGVVNPECYSGLAGWVSGGWDYQSSFTWLKQNHASALSVWGQFSAPPSSWYPYIDDLLINMGYRHKLNSVSHNNTVAAGSTLNVATNWTNSGNAPSYFSTHVIGYRFLNQADATMDYRVAGAIPATWNPSTVSKNENISIPTWLTAGTYSVMVGIVDSSTATPEVEIAVTQSDATTLWVHLTDLTITNGAPTAKPTTDYAAGFTAASSQYLSRASNSTLQLGGTDFTIGCWVKFTSFGATRVLVSKGDVGATGMEYALYYSNSTSRLTARVSNGTTLYTAAANTFGAPSTGVWYFVLMEFNNSTKSLSISVNNGTADSTTVSGNVQSSSNEFRVGSDTIGTGRYHDGALNNVFVAKRLYTSAQKAYLYNSGIKRSYPDLRYIHKGALQGWWNLDEAAGAARVDSTWRANNLTDHNTVAQVSA